MKRPRSHHRYDATKPGEDSLTLVLTSPQALSVACRLLQHLRAGHANVELALSGGHLTVRPPTEAVHVPPSGRRPKKKPKTSSLLTMGAIAPTHLTSALRS
ncbi:MAG: hypothetical protein ACAI34_25135 [Verrucomicrobium sp.]|nr:hypothetical protein [Verrucomicrobium sp.]